MWGHTYMSCLCTPATDSHLPMAIDTMPHQSMYESQAPGGVHAAVLYWHFRGHFLSHCFFFVFFLPFSIFFFFLLFQIFFLFFHGFLSSFFLAPSKLTLELALRLSQMPKFRFQRLDDSRLPCGQCHFSINAPEKKIHW